MENNSCASDFGERFAHTARDGETESDIMVCENQSRRLYAEKAINELLTIHTGRQRRERS